MIKFNLIDVSPSGAIRKDVGPVFTLEWPWRVRVR